jgi:hypothetical protein
VARLFVEAKLTAWGAETLVDDAVLLVDELVLNVLEHVAHGAPLIDITMVDHVVRVDVSDPEPDFNDEDDRDDRALPRMGLRIVDTVASRWGVLPSPSGKSVWFEFDLVPDSPESLVSAVREPLLREA